MKRIYQIVLASLLIAVLAACGFKLRGGGTLPPALTNVSIQVPAHASALERELERQLRVAGASIGGPNAAAIQVQGAALRKEIQTVSAAARVQEFRLSYETTFVVRDSSGKRIVGPQQIIQSADYVFNRQVVNANAREEAQIERDLIARSVAELIRRVRYADTP